MTSYVNSQGDVRYFQDLVALSATGASTSWEAGGALIHTQQMVVSSITAMTTTTRLVVNLQGSLDDSSFFNMSAFTISAAGVYYVGCSDAIKYLRNYVTFNTVGLCDITIKNLGEH